MTQVETHFKVLTLSLGTFNMWARYATADLLDTLYNKDQHLENQRAADSIIAQNSVLTWLSIPTFLATYQGLIVVALRLVKTYGIAGDFGPLYSAFERLAGSSLVVPSSEVGRGPLMICTPNWKKAQIQAAPIVLKVLEVASKKRTEVAESDSIARLKRV